jgi:hypothetical protein
MPFIGYARLGELVRKTEEEVRADKDQGVIDLDDFESLVRYVAGFWGWGPLGPLKEEVRSMSAELKAILEEQVAAKNAALPEYLRPADKQIGVKDMRFNTVKWKVEDRTETHTDDPYLDRVKKRRNGSAG